MLQKDNVDVVVVCAKQYYLQLISHPLHIQSSFAPKIFPINKPYNINNIIIFGVNHVI